MPSMSKMHKTAKKARKAASPTSLSLSNVESPRLSRNTTAASSPSRNSTTLTSTTSSNTSGRQQFSSSLYTESEDKNNTYSANGALADESRRTAQMMRGLTIRDVMQVTVPFRNQEGHHRFQDMEYVTGAGRGKNHKPAPRIQTPTKSPARFYAESYVPPGMSPPKKNNSSSSSSFSSSSAVSPTIAELKRLAIVKQKEIDIEEKRRREAKKRGERYVPRGGLVRKKRSTGGGGGGGGGAKTRRRSFNEGSNSRSKGSSRLLRTKGSAPTTRRQQEYPTKYEYPNERRKTAVDGLAQAPPVPPSRRKLAESREERSFRNGGMSASKKSKEEAEEAEVAAKLKVEQILADAARGRAVNGTWGKSKPPKQLWPSSAQKNSERRLQ